MKAMICKCRQCREVRKRSKRKTRIQTYQVRAARSRVKEMLREQVIKMGRHEGVLLPRKVKVDFYA